MGLDTSTIKKPEAYAGSQYGTVVNRSLLPSEVHGNLEVPLAALVAMLGDLTPAQFGARYGVAGKEWKRQGTVYKQYPGMSAPSSIYLGTWEYCGQAGSSYASRAGRFERAEGGSALSFGAGQQSDAIRNIEGGFYNGGLRYAYMSSVTGPFTANTWGDSGPGSSGYAGSSLYFSAANVVPTAGEIRPFNDTCRIWVCVSAPA